MCQSKSVILFQSGFLLWEVGWVAAGAMGSEVAPRWQTLSLVNTITYHASMDANVSDEDLAGIY
jgi:hypothetical protein